MTKKTRRSKARRALLALSLVLVTMMVTVGGTIAWLTDSTQQVVNTFNTSTIGVELSETTTDYKMIPGHTISKNPVAKVTTGSEEAWLFVTVAESANFRSYMTYEIADGWTEVAEGVYGREVLTADINTGFAILKDNQVKVLEGVTKADMTTAEANKPTLTFQAYVCQLYKTNGTKFTASEAWAIAPTNGSVSTTAE